MVKRIAFAVPGDLATPTGGYGYDRRIIAELGRLGIAVDVLDLGAGFPRPSPSQRQKADAMLGAIPADRPLVVDGLALGVLPQTAHRLVAPLVALVHHPLALESGMPAGEAEAMAASERAALAAARRVIVTSQATARVLGADYGVPPERIAVAPPGTDPRRPAQGSKDGVVRLIAVGAIVPRKGFDVLLAALALIPELPWRLAIAGDRSRDPEAAARLDAAIARFGLAGRIEMCGVLAADALAARYAQADIFVLASRYEGYGMAFAEAVAHGLPVIGTTAGAIPDTVPAGAGILVPPDDAPALAAALRRLIADPQARRTLAARARAAARGLPTWPVSARLFARAVEEAAA